MQPRSQSRLALLATMVLAIACSSTVSPAHTTSTRSTLAIAANNASAHGAFAGRIMGHPASGDSTPVGGATINVYVYQTAPGTQDTLPNQTKPDSIGTLTSASDGTFQLTNIPSGAYALNVIPSASSGFGARNAPFQFVSDGQTTATGDIGVYPK